MSDIDVYIYPNTSYDYDLARTAKYAVETGLDDVTSNTNVGYYSVVIRTPYPSQSTATRQEFFDNFRYWREQYGYTERGCHMGISADFGGGLADGGQYTNAFSTDANCVAGSTYGGGDYFENVAIQEMIHTLVDPGLYSVANMIEDDEHTLGMVYDSGYASPMISGYWNRGLGNAGSCRNNLSASGNTPYTTSCTEAAIEYTWADRTGGGGGGGEPPVADIAYSPSSPTVGETVTFDGSGSYDPDGGSIQSYYWEASTGGSANGQTVEGTWDIAQDVELSLTVTDDEDQTNTTSVVVTISNDGGGGGGGGPDLYCGSATNDQHVSAGRAYSSWSWYYYTYLYYAEGSDEYIGYQGSATTTLTEESEGYFVPTNSC